MRTKSKTRPNKPYDAALLEMRKARPDLALSARLLERGDKAGDPRATYALGTWYLFGRYFPTNIRKAMQLIRRAAKENVPSALFDLAVSYETGNGISKNTELAATSYLKAALWGDPQAVYEVGRCLHYGIGFARNRAQAKIWFERARELGTYESGQRSSRIRAKKLAKQ
ncbi:MAG TPA: tetratricopeptide repeat protein [Usitatibacter sp.]|nr:tetratricopeptide repeat protein [Usitatibacter sp.]